MSNGVGAWSDFKFVKDATELEQDIIQKAQPILFGANWTPQLISTQVVAGTNFRIIYLVSSVTYPSIAQSLVQLEGIRNLDGTITVKSQTEVHALGTHHNSLGGWTMYHDLSEKDQEIFTESALLGVDRKPFLVSKQVVAGVNYHFISLSSVVTPNAPQTIERLKVFKPLSSDKASIKRIDVLIGDLSEI